MLDRLSTATGLLSHEPAFEGPADQGAVRDRVQRVYVDALLDLSHSARATPDVRALAEQHLLTLAALCEQIPGEGALAAHRASLARDIRSSLARPELSPRQRPAPAAAPPGSPIGLGEALAGCGLHDG